MTGADVEVGKYYHFEFQGAWSDFTGDYCVTGYTAPDTIALIDATVNLLKTYFEDYGMGNDKYETYINSSTKIIIANKVTSKNPIEKDESDFVYLPASLINFAKSSVYLDAVKLNITVHSGVKHFDNLTDKKDFIKKTLVNIKDSFDKMDDYSGEMISVDYEEVETITTQEEIDKILSSRERAVNNRLKAKMQTQLTREASERNLYEKLAETKVEKEKYMELSNSLATKINEVESLRVTNTNEADTLNGVKNNMIKMLNMIITGETTINALGNTGVEVFENLYNLARESN